jgi:homoserine O-succinyltransferase
MYYEPATARAVCRSRRTPLIIGLVNNMPDAALRATERQFCTLLSAASRNLVVQLKLFSLPEIPRSQDSLTHIDRYYEDIAELTEDPPDGLIVTGTEPRAGHLKDEPYWCSLSRLVSWTQDKTIPCVWSCLAAHAAVLHLDGIERYRLPRKLSGVFNCHINSTDHEILRGMPDEWCVPHSRLFGLPEDTLLSHNYNVVSWSPDTGADVFVRKADSLCLFFQGHPEYSSTALLGEYRRDVSRFLFGERESHPEVPRHYFNRSVEVELGKLRERALRSRDPELMREFAAIVARSTLQDPWSSTAAHIYTNWLLLLSEQRARGPSPTGCSESVIEPFGTFRGELAFAGKSRPTVTGAVHLGGLHAPNCAFQARSADGQTMASADRSRPFANGAVDFLGVPIHLLTMRETEARIVAAMREKRPIQHVAMNVAKLVHLKRDAELRKDVFGADLVSVDGMGILLGARLFRIRVPERVAGVDLMEIVLARCAQEGFRPYLLGARPEVLDKALKELGRRHPSLEIAGSHHGYFVAAEEANVVEAIRATQPDCLFVGMPTPRKERFMAKYRTTLAVPFVMGVGGSIDILAGHVRRAPIAWQRRGMEWLYRTWQEPKRMWRRYLVTNLAFTYMLAAAMSRRALGLGDPM